jgi:ribosomal protein L16/L10AE
VVVVEDGENEVESIVPVAREALEAALAKLPFEIYRGELPSLLFLTS